MGDDFLTDDDGNPVEFTVDGGGSGALSSDFGGLQGLDLSGLADLNTLGSSDGGMDMNLSGLGNMDLSNQIQDSATQPGDLSIAGSSPNSNSMTGALGRLLGLSNSGTTSDIIKTIAGLLGAYGAYSASKGTTPTFNPPAMFGGQAGSTGGNAGGTATGYGPAGGYNHSNYTGLTAASPQAGLGYTPRTQVTPNIPNYYTYGQGPQASFYAPSGAGAPVQNIPTQSQTQPFAGTNLNTGGAGGMRNGGLFRKYAVGGAATMGNMANTTPQTSQLGKPQNFTSQGTPLSQLAHPQWAGPNSANPGMAHMAAGGLSSEVSNTVRGDGDGTSDSIPARLADGEWIVDAQTVSMLGNGSNDAGARLLDKWRTGLRQYKGKALAKGEMAPDTTAQQMPPTGDDQ